MDYPIFLGIAVYLALVGLQRDLFGVRPLDILRWSAAITLMWASIEKWAYPQWTFPLFITHPALTMGYSSEFFMRAAGVVEFTLSFALFLTPLVRRFAALILGVMFIIAIPIFGKIDAIGHAPIIAVLLAIIADNLAGYQFRPAHAVVKSAGERPHEMLSKWHWVHFPIGYFASLAGFFDCLLCSACRTVRDKAHIDLRYGLCSTRTDRSHDRSNRSRCATCINALFFARQPFESPLIVHGGQAKPPVRRPYPNWTQSSRSAQRLLWDHAGHGTDWPAGCLSL